MIVPSLLLLTILPSGCASNELVLSRTLRPVLSTEEITFPITQFRARVQKQRLEVWARVERSDGDYRADFDCELESTAALCAAVARSDLSFEHDWSELVLEVTNEYGSRWRWRNTFGYTKLSISRETLIDLRERGSQASEYPRHGHLLASKVGPPDYVAYEWSPAPAPGNSPR